MKIKGINFLSISELCKSSTWLVTVYNDLSAGLCSQIIVKVCFRRKAFFKPVMAAIPVQGSTSGEISE